MYLALDPLTQRTHWVGPVERGAWAAILVALTHHRRCCRTRCVQHPDPLVNFRIDTIEPFVCEFARDGFAGVLGTWPFKGVGP